MKQMYKEIHQKHQSKPKKKKRMIKRRKHAPPKLLYNIIF